METATTEPTPRLLKDPPSDGVTALQYLPVSDSFRLAATSWDGTVNLYDTAATATTTATTSSSSKLLTHNMESGPLLSLAVLDKNSLVTGGLDGSVQLLDIETSSVQLVGRHTGATGASTASAATSPEKCACSCLSYISSSLVASAGWDRQWHVWDVRASQKQPIASVELPGKAFGMDYDKHYNRAVVATSGRRTCFISLDDKMQTASMALDRESSLKYQTRCVKFFPDGAAIAVGSIEGRVAVEFLEELGLAAKKKYAFKCHRSGDLVYPVNSICFHPRYGTFATGGCDGTIALWDGLHKKKLATLPALPTSVASMAFSPDGTELAMASSYTFEDGERAHPHDEIYVRAVLDDECRPKSKE